MWNDLPVTEEMLSKLVDTQKTAKSHHNHMLVYPQGINEELTVT